MPGFQREIGSLQQEAGFGFDGLFYCEGVADGLTALAGGGQSGATKLTTMVNRVTTVATAGDSVVLPPIGTKLGLSISVINAGAAILNVFPDDSSQINALGASNAYAVPPGAVATFFCTAAGAWYALISAPGAPQHAYNAASSTAAFTATGAQISGGTAQVTLDLTGTLAADANVRVPTVAALVAAMTVAGINPTPGMTYELDIIQRSAANAWTVITNTGWTLTGTMTLASGTMRKCYVTLTSLTAAVLRSVGTQAIGVA